MCVNMKIVQSVLDGWIDECLELNAWLVALSMQEIACMSVRKQLALHSVLFRRFTSLFYTGVLNRYILIYFSICQ